MSKRRSKKTTLTKIDPASLRPKLQAISQHASEDGTTVTTAVNPPRNPPPFDESDIFNANPLNFKGDSLGDDSNEDEVAREYYVARVCSSHLFNALRLTVVRTTHYC